MVGPVASHAWGVSWLVMIWSKPCRRTPSSKRANAKNLLQIKPENEKVWGKDDNMLGARKRESKHLPNISIQYIDNT